MTQAVPVRPDDARTAQGGPVDEFKKATGGKWLELIADAGKDERGCQERVKVAQDSFRIVAERDVARLA